MKLFSARRSRLDWFGWLLLSLCLVVGRPASGQSTSDLAARAMPGVVTILAYDKAEKLLRIGSGFVVREDGVIATASHVLEKAHSIRVKFANGAVYRALHILNADRRRDLALLQIGARDLDPLAFGSLDTLRQGDKIVVVGSPAGLEFSVSEGIVSAIRRLSASDVLLQLSAPMSPGSSGGPVLNDRGEVVGMAVSKLNEGENLNFAVPINAIRENLTGVQLRPAPVVVTPPPSAARKTPLPARTGKTYSKETTRSANRLLQQVALEMQKAARADDPPQRRAAYQTAAQLLAQAADYRPDWPETRYLQGACLQEAQQPQEALAAFRAALRLRPEEPRYGYAVAHTLYETFVEKSDALDAPRTRATLQEVIALCRQVVAADPRHAKGHSLLGRACLQAGETEAGLRALGQAARLNPNDADAHALLAAHPDADPEAAYAAFQALRRLKAAFSPPVRFYTRLGLVCEQTRRYEEAIGAYRNALASEGEPPPAALRLRLARCLRALQQEPEAREVTEQFLADSPDKALAYYQLGESLYHPLRPFAPEQEEIPAPETLEAALQAYQAACRLAPNREEAPVTRSVSLDGLPTSRYSARAARLRIASIHYARQEWAEVIACLQPLAQSPSISVLALLALGDAFARLGQTPEALKAYQRPLEMPLRTAEFVELGEGYARRLSAARHSPELSRTLAALRLEAWRNVARAEPGWQTAHWQLGRAYADAGQWAEAADAYQLALNCPTESAGSRFAAISQAGLRPDATDLYFALGDALAQQRKSAETVWAVYAKPLELRMTLSECARAAGRYFERDYVNAALLLYKQALLADPEYPDALHGLGRCYLALSDKNAALEQYKKLHNLRARSPEAARYAEDLFNRLYPR